MSNCSVLQGIGNYWARRRFDLSPKSFDSGDMIDRFNELTGCLNVTPCGAEEVCDKESTIICNILLTQTDYILDPAGYITTGIELYNAKAPYTIKWFYGETALVSGQGTDTLRIKADYNHLVGSSFQIAVQVIDNVGCESTVYKTVLIPRAEVNCNSFALTGPTLYEGVPFTGSFTLGYIDGNAKSYNGLAIQSTGVTGLTATLAGGTLASGVGTLTFNVTGTPTNMGIATFPLSLFGYSCNPTISIADIADLCPPVPIGYSTEFYNYSSGEWVIKLLWGPGGIDYDLTYTIGGTPTTETIAAPTYYKLISVPPSTAFSASLVSNCDVINSSVAATFAATTAVAPTPPTCPVVGTLTVGGTPVFDPVAGDYVYTLTWTAAAGATGYHITTPTAIFDVTSGTLTASIHLQAGATRAVTFSTHCGNGNYSSVLIRNVVVPAVPLPVAPPTMHTLHNIGTPPNYHLETWFTTDALQYGIGAEIIQGPLFGAYVSNSGILTIGANNGYTPVPGSFGSDDIYFNELGGLPIGYPILGNSMSKLKLKLNKTSTIFDIYEYWMNIPQALGLRQDLSEDYIPMFDDTVTIRPVLTLGSIASTSTTINFNPNGLNYDSCSSYNMFLVDSTGTIISAIPASYTPQTYTFTGLAPATTYIVYFEMTHDSCTLFTSAWVTASPLMITTTP